MGSEIENEVPAARAGADSSTALTSIQTDSFKGLENFSSIKSSMTDTSSSALPTLDLFSSDDKAGEKPTPEGQGDPPRERRNFPTPRGIGQQGSTDSLPGAGLEDSNNRNKPDNGSKPTPPPGERMQRRMPGR